MLKEDLIWQHNSYGDMLKWLFQSTLPQGERPAASCTSTASPAISIHAPTRGATIPGHGHLWHTAMISIHAPTRGATHLTELLDPFTVISIHAPTRGATPMGVQYLPVSADFNPRSHKGSDVSWDGFFRDLTISIHAPTRGATK